MPLITDTILMSVYLITIHRKKLNLDQSNNDLYYILNIYNNTSFCMGETQSLALFDEAKFRVFENKTLQTIYWRIQDESEK